MGEAAQLISEESWLPGKDMEPVLPELFLFFSVEAKNLNFYIKISEF